MRRPARIAAFLALACISAACSDGAIVAPDGSDVAAARGKKKGGGGAEPAPPTTDELLPWDTTLWSPQSHTLGKSWLDAANVTQGPIGLLLTLPAGSYGGAEILSAERHRYRDLEARMKTPDAPGSISALFFYEGVRRRNDEIDIEIFNDGTRTVLFTTWVQGKQTNHVQTTLPFDPAAGYHDYRIEWENGRVRFLVDGTVLQTFSGGVPRDAMYIMANAWWPTWLSGPEPTAPVSLGIDRIIY